ncbi:MAG TPA: hypothetical protein VHT00_14670 [Stellaceae bacterium]|jgi:hypothetical protein|nr:hypothetical protein [Stellaceae bacterium]
MPLCTGVTGLRSKTLLAVVLSVLGLALLVWLAYRGWSILLLAPGAAIGREKLRQRPRPRHKGLWRWRDALFILMSNNTLDAPSSFGSHPTVASSSVVKSRFKLLAEPYRTFEPTSSPSGTGPALLGEATC